MPIERRFKANLTDYNAALERSGTTLNCFKLSERTVHLLLGQVDYLGWKSRYVGHQSWTSTETNEVMQWAERAREELLDDNQNCADDSVGCYDISPVDGRLVYYPTNPYTQGNVIPEGYILPPFAVVDGSIIDTILGLVVGDILVPYLALPFFGWTPSLTVPSIRYEFSGKGELETHLLNVPQGGLTFITYDDNLFDTQIVDCSSFALLEFESWIEAIEGVFPQFASSSMFAETIIEKKFETDGLHSVEVRFFPKLGGSEIVGFGGGFRKFTWCSDVDDCCGENNQIFYQIFVQTQRAIQRDQAMQDDGDTALSFDAPPTFNGDESPNRERALCRTVNNYVSSALRDAAAQSNILADVAGAIERFLPFAHPIDGVVGVALDLLTSAHMRDLLDDCEAIRDVACCMTGALRGQDTTIANFRGALGDCGFSFGSHAAEIAAMVNRLSQDEGNGRAFIASMDSDYQQSGLSGGASADDCDCDCPCDSFDIIPVDYLGTGCTYQYMGQCVWKITSSAITGSFNACFKDSLNRCLAWDSEVGALGYPLPGCANTSKIGCCGGVDLDADCNFSTGVWGGRLVQVAWESAPSVANYYRVSIVAPDDCEE